MLVTIMASRIRWDSNSLLQTTGDFAAMCQRFEGD